MSVMMSQPAYLGWTLGVSATLVGLFGWRYRRWAAGRRIAKGLRSYTANAQVVS